MTQKSVEITRKGAQHSFSHPDCDRRYRNFTGSCGKTPWGTGPAGGDPRPPLRISFYFEVCLFSSGRKNKKIF